ncbi:hypothetical protein MMC26_004751 [Xylographa opegraphella]|nr:hypothetical protein [Xylographa opegraphella]
MSAPTTATAGGLSMQPTENNFSVVEQDNSTSARGWRNFISRSKAAQEPPSASDSLSNGGDYQKLPVKWSMGVLNDKQTDEVPGSILLMPKESSRNEPLGLRNAPARTSASSLPSPFPPGLESTSRALSHHSIPEKKRTKNGQIILEPQPEESLNDPLNWPSWRRDIALISLGFYCMVGGGMTPVLAAGFNNVAATYKIPEPKVALTTGFYMMGLGLGSVVASPTAILFGKRPVYLAGIILFLLSAIWCALSPNYASLVVARILMGVAVSPVECLPSATIAEIFFLHERAFRLGIYTLLLLGGKNLVPLVSAAIIQGLDWQWVFWVVAMIVTFCFALIFFFVPETFWDRTPRPHAHSKSRKSTLGSISAFFGSVNHTKTLPKDEGYHGGDATNEIRKYALGNSMKSAAPDPSAGTIAQRRQQKNKHHVGFADGPAPTQEELSEGVHPGSPEFYDASSRATSSLATPVYISHDRPGPIVPPSGTHLMVPGAPAASNNTSIRPLATHADSWRVEPRGEGPQTPGLHNFNSPSYLTEESPSTDYLRNEHDLEAPNSGITAPGSLVTQPATAVMSEKSTDSRAVTALAYTHHLRTQPPKTFRQTLKPWNGRLRHDKWLKVAIRPFILFAYPSILWSTLVYSLSVGWLIVLSETVSAIYRSPAYTYNFSPLGTGLVYISPFIGGILGTAVAGKLSDVIVQFMSRKNGGVYEPEFRLVMALPVAITTCIGLMGFGWSAGEHDRWIVPTVFFGIISFGCSLGSTTAITFAVDSYRQYAGEALVTMNFSKNIFHGLVFSLFFPNWLVADGSKSVFIAIGCIQLGCLTTTIPMYIYGKRARMWTVRKNMMEKF